MRASVRGLRAGDHLCWTYRSVSERRRLAYDLLEEAGSQGSRFLYFSDLPSVEMAEELERVDGDGGLVARTAAETVSFAELPDHDLTQRSGMMVDAAREAVRAGFTGLRVLADSTDAVSTSERRAVWIACEQEADRRFHQQPISVVCAYDVAVLGVSTTSRIRAVHPLVSRKTQMQVFATDGADLALRGGFDASSVTFLEQALDRLPAPAPGRTMVIDAHEVEFIDLRTLQMMDRYAQRNELEAVELRDAPAMAGRLLHLVPMTSLRLVATG